MSLRDLVLDPVVAKELSGSSRRWQTFAPLLFMIVRFNRIAGRS